MTTRAQLESEREALRRVMRLLDPVQFAQEHAALTASIARVEALLSLSDEQCAAFCRHMESVIREIGVVARLGDPHGLRPLPPADGPHRTVANLIRREPRGDV